MESKELTVRQDRIVSQYGQSAEVATMAERILYMLPGVKKIGKHAAYALAQVAVSMGLNPFIGEIWAIPGKGGFSISGGIKAYRRAARNEMKRQDGCYDLQFRLPTKDEVEGVDLQPGWLVRVCKLTLFSRRALKFADYTKRLPTYTGIGIFRGSLEHTQMQPLQCVRKRAEADALKQAFDLPLAFADYTDPQNGHDPYVSRRENAIPDAAQGGDEPLDVQDAEMVPPDEFDDEYEDGVYLDQEPTTTVTPPTTPAENSSVENGGEKATTAARHWIDGETRNGKKVSAAFWAWVGSELGLSNDEVHEALEVESVKDYGGTMGEAKEAVLAWADEQATIGNSESVPEVQDA